MNYSPPPTPTIIFLPYLFHWIVSEWMLSKEILSSTLLIQVGKHLKYNMGGLEKGLIYLMFLNDGLINIFKAREQPCFSLPTYSLWICLLQCQQEGCVELSPIKSGTMSDSCPTSSNKEGERSLAVQGGPGLEGTPNQTLTLQLLGPWCPFHYIPGAYFYNGVNPFLMTSHWQY